MDKGIMVTVYRNLSKGMMCRYGRGKGSLACYRLTVRGREFVEIMMGAIDGAIGEELMMYKHKKARSVGDQA